LTNFIKISVYPLFFILFAFATGCDSDIPDEKKSLLTKMASSNDGTAPDIPKVESKMLLLSDLSAVKTELAEGSYGVSIDASPPALARFIELKICSAESLECVNHSTPFNRLTLHDLPTGKLEITARACIEKKFSLDGGTCGASTTIMFENPERSNPELDTLYNQRWQIRESIDNYTKELNKNLEIFKEEIIECQKDSARRQKAATIEKALSALFSLGEKFIEMGMKDFLSDDKLVSELDKAKTESIPADKAKEEASKTFSKVEGGKDSAKGPYPSDFLNSLEAYIKSITLFGHEVVPKDFALSTYWADLIKKGHKPANAIKYIGGSVFTLFNAQNMFIPTCIAEQRLKTNNASAIMNLKTNGQKLRDVEEAIIRVGGAL
jgi:hypothetical protein